MKKDQVAIIILNYKSWEDTLSLAEAIQKLFLLNWNQIIIIDNNSPNESDKKLNEFSDKGYIYIQTGQNNGYAAGNNIGLKYAYKNGFKYGWILNNDIIKA